MTIKLVIRRQKYVYELISTYNPQKKKTDTAYIYKGVLLKEDPNGNHQYVPKHRRKIDVSKYSKDSKLTWDIPDEDIPLSLLLKSLTLQNKQAGADVLDILINILLCDQKYSNTEIRGLNEFIETDSIGAETNNNVDNIILAFDDFIMVIYEKTIDIINSDISSLKDKKTPLEKTTRIYSDEIYRALPELENKVIAPDKESYVEENLWYFICRSFIDIPHIKPISYTLLRSLYILFKDFEIQEYFDFIKWIEKEYRRRFEEQEYESLKDLLEKETKKSLKKHRP